MTIEFPPCPNPKVPAAEAPFHHYVDIQLRFNDFDGFGHVNNGSYMQYLDVAKMAYFENLLGHLPAIDEIAAVIVNVNASFYSPTYPGEALRVATRCKSISQHSFVLRHRVYNPDTGDVKCIASSVLAAFDPSTRTSCEVSPHWRQLLTDFDNL